MGRSAVTNISTCSIHHVPGRLRVRMADMKGNPARAAALVTRLHGLEGIHSAQANSLTGSILIRYDIAATSAKACLAALNVQPARQRTLPAKITTKIAEAATWYIVEKAIERSLPLLLAALL